MPTKEFIDYERQCLQITRSHSCPFQGRDQAIAQLHQLGGEAFAVSGFAKECPAHPTDFFRLRLSESTIRNVDKAARLLSKTPETSVKQSHVDEAKAFVGNLYGIDLMEVPVHISSSKQTAYIEAFYMSCGMAEGEVFLPSKFSSPIELICHELGHAAHSKIRRTGHPIDPAFWAGSQIESEFAAYFAQFSYLLAHGNRNRFYQALGVLITSAAQLICLLHTSKNFSLQSFIADKDVHQYSGSAFWPNLIHMFKGMQPNNDPQQQAFQTARGQHVTGYGLCLALKCIDNPAAMASFMANDSSSVPLAEKLATAFPDQDNLTHFDDINLVIKKLASRIKP